LDRTHPATGDGLSLASDGAQRVRSALDSTSLRAVAAALPELAPDRAGARLHGIAALRPFLASSGAIGAVAASVLGAGCRPVRAILFDKTEAMNWALGWHQDRTIAVAARIELEGFSPWTAKNGIPHVAPPFALLAGMVTLRVHLDRVTTNNAPLLIAPGSHRLGCIAGPEVAEVVRRCGRVVCLAEAGDIWLYATSILHASEAASEPAHRRVLQVDFAASTLPGGLEWYGV